MLKPPSLRNNNGSLQVRVRIDGRDAFINRLGRWSDPVAVARAQAISAQIWSDFQQGTFDRSLMAYQPLINGKEVGLLEALKARAESKRQSAATCYVFRHCYMSQSLHAVGGNIAHARGSFATFYV